MPGCALPLLLASCTRAPRPPRDLGGCLEGLDRDLEIIGNDSDKLQRQIVEGIGNAMGKENKSFYEIKMTAIDEKIIFQITMTKNEVGPTWVNFNNDSKFYIREGN